MNVVLVGRIVDSVMKNGGLNRPSDEGLIKLSASLATIKSIFDVSKTPQMFEHNRLVAQAAKDISAANNSILALGDFLDSEVDSASARASEHGHNPLAFCDRDRLAVNAIFDERREFLIVSHKANQAILVDPRLYGRRNYRVKNWHQFAWLILGLFREAIETTNPGEYIGFSGGPGCQFLAKVIPLVTTERPCLRTITQFLKESPSSDRDRKRH